MHRWVLSDFGSIGRGGRLDLDEGLAFVDVGAWGDVKSFDHAVLGGFDFVFHLHGFEDQEDIACLDVLPCGDHDADDGSRHKCGDATFADSGICAVLDFALCAHRSKSNLVDLAVDRDVGAARKAHGVFLFFGGIERQQDFADAHLETLGGFLEVCEKFLVADGDADLLAVLGGFDIKAELIELDLSAHRHESSLLGWGDTTRRETTNETCRVIGIFD